MGIYQICYDLLNTYLFGGIVDVGTYQDLICILLSAIGCIFIFAIPFIIIWRTIKIFLG